MQSERHLEADDQQDGLYLLQRANLEGLSCSRRSGWVTIIPGRSSERRPRLLEAYEGCLLDQDADWMFQV